MARHRIVDLESNTSSERKLERWYGNTSLKMALCNTRLYTGMFIMPSGTSDAIDGYHLGTAGYNVGTLFDYIMLMV